MKNNISITWNDLSATVNGKDVLKGCSGYCRPGEMLAIMGPSGAGKTTLLSLLSKRESASLSVEGQVAANNWAFNGREFYQFGAFVYQNDLLFENLTVRETLEFAALLKIPSQSAAQEKVQDLIAEFQLQKCANTFVGGSLRKGISGGEKKRLCVSIQMVSEPAVIILDEPTSGLDSNKAAKLLSVLKKLASKNHTIIFTIHQPSYLQYIKLDRLILLDRGQTIYQGPADQIGSYMRNLDISVSQKSTICDVFMMEISQFKREKMGYSSPLNGDNYTLRLAHQNNKTIDSIKQQPALLADHLAQIYMSSFLFSFKMIIRRDYLNIFRGGWKIKVIAMQTIMKILLLGFLYRNQIPSAEDLYASDNPSKLFIFAQTASFSSAAGNLMPALLSVALSLPAQRQLYYKQTDSKKYHPLPYFLSKVFVEYSLVFTGTLIFASGGYWMLGYTRSFDHFINYTLIVLTAAAVGNSVGFFCATLFREIRRVSALTSIVMIPLFVLSGLFNKLNFMPDWSSWLQYISPFRYGLHLLLENGFGDQVFNNYDYKADLGINLSYGVNWLILLGQGLFFYSASFFLLKFYTARIAA